MTKNLAIFYVTIMMVLTGCIDSKQVWSGDNHIRPWTKNRSYWQYKGEPLLLLGGTMNDNLFQNQNVKTHLDSLKTAGGNYIRNTMSDRDAGNLDAFVKDSSGKFDLNALNEEYWHHFENLLKLAKERDIIVQIEIWDRFDHSRDPWKKDPFNPMNNINYSFEESGLDSVYPLHPYRNDQPFFYTVPELNNNNVVLRYQQLFVDKLLSISLKYNNVLYCIDNETSGEEEWAAYWADYIKDHSGGRDIYVTEMWDDWDVKSETHKRTTDHPERFGFIDISQNSQIPGNDNWWNAQYIFDYIRDNPRPVNSTKVYGSDNGSWLDRGITTEHAVNTFFRNILGGFASSRFHRPPSGLGLSDISMGCIGTVRKIETLFKFWEISPRMDLLMTEEEDEVYLSAKEGEYYVIFFAKDGTVKLDLSNYDARFTAKRINVYKGEWVGESKVKGGALVDIEGNSGLAVLIIK